MDIKDIKSSFQYLGGKITQIALKNDFTILPNDEKLKYKLDAEYDIIQCFVEDDVRYGIIDLSVKAEVKLKNKEKIFISICIEGCFTDSVDIGEEDFKSMLSLNGSATLYSIARAQIINLSSQAMSGGQIILPMINLFKMKEKKENI